jgi:long-chain acyl-CoA synthetase
VAERPAFATVTAPIAYWAEQSGQAIALDDDERRLTFGALAEFVRRRAASVAAEQGPAIGWMRDSESQIDRLIDFCAIVETGRAAAVSDPDWPPALRRRIESALAHEPEAPLPPGPDSAFYVGFTSGSTGLPKGFRRDHRSWTESFQTCLTEFGEGAAATIVAPGRLSHSLFLFAALLGIWTGAGAHLQDRFSARHTLDVVAMADACCLVAVPSQLMMMLDAAERRRQEPISGVRLILISGARWMRSETPRLRTLFPHARIVEFYGASETSFIAWTESSLDLPETVVGRPFANVDLQIRGASHEGEPGLIFVRSPMLFTEYLIGEDGSLLRDGAWISVRDMGFVDSEGRLHLLGREKRMIVTQGKNVFPEEVEAVLEQHPAIAAASVAGLPDPLRGTRVAAVVQPSGTPLAPALLTDFCRARLAAFKVPRAYFLRDEWPRTAGGKTDHARLAAELAQAAVPEPAEETASCLLRLM